MQKAGQFVVVGESNGRRGVVRGRGFVGRGIWVAWSEDALMLMLLLHILGFQAKQH